jgi:Mycothiol maleylpyruvate isomerase N-terminal domain
MAGDPTWDFQDPASKGRLLGVLRREIDEMFELAAEPERWNAPTACPGWEVRDMVGHLLDATEGYLSAFDIAHRGVVPPEHAEQPALAGRHGHGIRRGCSGIPSNTA